MSETVSIKKSTAKKISAIILCIIILSVLGWVSNQVYSTDRATLTSQSFELQNELSNKNQEVASLNKQSSNLQNQVNNLQQIASSKTSDLSQLNLEINNLNAELKQANQNITSLSNQIAEANTLIAQLQKIYPTPILK
jgi:peptidoglycan hydrolase CwlO-like protein